jgi:5-(carboxyamino)imidazole ribonucleotide mutase
LDKEKTTRTEMTSEKIVIMLGSASDFSFAHHVEDFLREARFPVKFEYRVNSAHRNPEKLLNDIRSYEQSSDKIVFITVAGLSDALSGVAAANSKFPVIACPPDIEKHGLAKMFSAVMTPKGVAVCLASSPENAAFAAVKILALANASLQKHVSEYIDEIKNAVVEADAEITGKEVGEREREHIERIEHLEHSEHVEHGEDTEDA